MSETKDPPILLDESKTPAREGDIHSPDALTIALEEAEGTSFKQAFVDITHGPNGVRIQLGKYLGPKQTHFMHAEPPHASRRTPERIAHVLIGTDTMRIQYDNPLDFAQQGNKTMFCPPPIGKNISVEELFENPSLLHASPSENNAYTDAIVSLTPHGILIEILNRLLFVLNDDSFLITGEQGRIRFCINGRTKTLQIIP